MPINIVKKKYYNASHSNKKRDKRTSKSTNSPSFSVSSLPSDGNLPPTTRPLVAEALPSEAVDFAAIFLAGRVAGADFFTTFFFALEGAMLDERAEGSGDAKATVERGRLRTATAVRAEAEVIAEASIGEGEEKKNEVVFFSYFFLHTWHSSLFSLSLEGKKSKREEGQRKRCTRPPLSARAQALTVHFPCK